MTIADLAMTLNCIWTAAVLQKEQKTLGHLVLIRKTLFYHKKGLKFLPNSFCKNMPASDQKLKIDL